MRASDLSSIILVLVVTTSLCGAQPQTKQGTVGAGQPQQYQTDRLPWESLATLPRADAVRSGGAEEEDSPTGRAHSDPFGMPAQFWTKNWQTEPVHIRAPDASGRFDDLMDGDADLEELVTDNVLRLGSGGNVKLVKEGRQGHAEGRLTSTRLQEFYSMGATVVFDQLERLWPPITELARSVQQWSGIRTEVNMYRTPPNALGFQAHYDFEDVFIVQVQGVKRWRVWTPDPLVGQQLLPVKDPRSEVLRSKDYVPSTEPVAVELRAGDVLYIPRGFPHMAETYHSTGAGSERTDHPRGGEGGSSGEGSLHLTVTLMDQENTWEKLLQALVMTGDPQAWPVLFEVGSRLGAQQDFGHPAKKTFWTWFDRQTRGRDEDYREDDLRGTPADKLIARLRAPFEGCRLKETARNVSFVNGAWVAAGILQHGDHSTQQQGSIVDTTVSEERRMMTMEGVLLLALHRIILATPEFRMVHSPKWATTQSHVDFWTESLEAWTHSVGETFSLQPLESMTVECSEVLAGGGKGRRRRLRHAGGDVATAQALLRDIFAAAAAGEIEPAADASSHPRSVYGDTRQTTFGLQLAKEWLDQQLVEMATTSGKLKSKGSFLGRAGSQPL